MRNFPKRVNNSDQVEFGKPQSSTFLRIAMSSMIDENIHSLTKEGTYLKFTIAWLSREVDCDSRNC